MARRLTPDHALAGGVERARAVEAAAARITADHDAARRRARVSTASAGRGRGCARGRRRLGGQRAEHLLDGVAVEDDTAARSACADLDGRRGATSGPRDVDVVGASTDAGHLAHHVVDVVDDDADGVGELRRRRRVGGRSARPATQVPHGTDGEPAVAVADVGTSVVDE